MATKSQRYKIYIYMRGHDQNSNQTNYVWRNSNTGIHKVIRNLNELHGNKWDYFDVERKTNKEIVATFYNTYSYDISAIRLYLPFRPNSKNTGVILSLKFKRGDFEIQRGINMSNKVILERFDDYISIPMDIFRKAVEQAKFDLYNYYLEKGHQIAENEIEISDFSYQKFTFTKTRVGTSFIEDYP